MDRRHFLAVTGTVAAGLLAAPAVVRAQQSTLKVGLGPQQPTQAETQRVWEPIYQAVADQAGLELELQIANDWAGIATALANEQVDVAQMGPWGYILARNNGGATPIAVMLVDGRPIYHAIIVGRPGLEIADFPAGAKGLSMQMLDRGSTSGWLVPTHYLKTAGIEPAEFFSPYSEGASAAAAQLATAESQVDLATGWDTLRNTMILHGTLEETSNRVVWESAPLPNEVVAVRAGMPEELAMQLQAAFVGLPPEIVAQLPPPYTGFQPTTHEPYRALEQMGRDLGVLR